MPPHDKALMAERFRKSLHRYRENAPVQSMMARGLTRALASLGQKRYETVFEIGCGAGFLTEELAKEVSFSRYILNDIVAECGDLACEIKGGEFICGDIEEVGDLPDKIDLTASNAAFQWLHDLPAFLKKLAGKMNGGATLAFTTFGTGNMEELGAACGARLDYLSGEELKSVLNPDFSLFFYREDTVNLTFPDPLSVLRHVKATGTSGLALKRWTRGDLERFCREYEARACVDGGVSLTYRPITVVARKRKG